MTGSCVSLIEILQKWVVEKGDDPAYTYVDSRLNQLDRVTYKELFSHVKKAAEYLYESGIQKRDHVLLVYQPGIEFISALLACNYLGALGGGVIYPKSASEAGKLLAIANSIDAKRILTSVEKQSELSEWVDPSFFMSIPAHSELNDKNEKGICSVRGEDAFIQLTSGSTGLAKALRVSHKSCLYNLKMMQAAAQSTDETVFVSWLPHYHDLGLVAHILLSLFSGGHCILMSPSSFIHRPSSWLKAISKYKGNYSGAPDFAYRLCVDRIKDNELDGVDLSSLSLSISASEPISAETINDFVKRFSKWNLSESAIYPAYGMAEATVFVSGGDFKARPIYKKVDLNALSAGKIQLPVGKAMTLVGCGKTWMDQEIQIVNPDTLEKHAPNCVGEIWVSGENVLNGYLHNEVTSRETFIEINNVKYLRTGDLGFIDEDGELYVTGRIKDVVIIRGANYYPHEIENVVSSAHKNVMAGYTVAFNADNRDLVVVAGLDRHALRSISNGEVIGKEIADSCRQLLLEKIGLYVDDLIFVNPKEIPRTSSGKVCRRNAKAMYINDEFSIVAGRSVLSSNNGRKVKKEKNMLDVLLSKDESYFKVFTVVSRILSNKFDIDVASIEHDKTLFFYGLDSIKIIELHAEIERQLNIKINSSDLFDAVDFDKMLTNIANSYKGIVVERDNCSLDDIIESKVLEVEELISKEKKLLPENENGEVVITGASGFFGSFILESVLRNTDANVVCIVRGENSEIAKKRVLSAFKKYDVPLAEDNLERVEFLVGDVAKVNMGLVSLDYERLVKSSFMIIHCAAVDNFYLPYSAISRTNVAGTMEAIKFCLTGRKKRMEHISSCAVDLINDGDFEADTNGLRNGYAQSKYVSEKIVNFLSSRGVKANTYKLGYLYKFGLADLEDGDSFETLMHAITEMKKIPEMDMVFDLTPVDFAAEKIVRTAFDPSNTQSLHTFYNPAPISWSSIMDYFDEVGSVQRVSLESFVDDYQTYLLNSDRDSAKLLKSVVSEDLAEQINRMFKNQKTDVSEVDSMDCPVGSKEFVFRYLDDILGRVHIDERTDGEMKNKTIKDETPVSG